MEMVEEEMEIEGDRETGREIEDEDKDKDGQRNRMNGTSTMEGIRKKTRRVTTKEIERGEAKMMKTTMGRRKKGEGWIL